MTSILRHLARSAPNSGLYGTPHNDAFAASEVDQWLDAAHEVTKDGLEAFVDRLNNDLTFRTFLAGYRITVADICIWAVLKSVQSPPPS